VVKDSATENTVGRIITLHFNAEAAGSGDIMLEAVKYGNLQGENDTPHDSTSEALTLTLETVTLAHLTITAE